MRDAIASRLLELNREFYQSFAEPFSQTRDRLQPGVLRALETLPRAASILDLGCGHGLIASYLETIEHQGPYLGVDSSRELLAMARGRAGGERTRFLEADLANPDWIEHLPAAAGMRPEALRPHFNRIYAFATLHHIPGGKLRKRLAMQLRELLSDEGSLALSVWNFLASPRLRRRIVPWREVGLKEEHMEEGDFLLDWRRGGQGLRYVHHFTEPELNALAEAAGFRVAAAYLSDGERGRLGRYQVWKRA